MPVYYDENEAMFDFIEKLAKENNILINYLAYCSYVYDNVSVHDTILSEKNKITYEFVISELKNRFSHISEEDCELVIAEYIDIEESRRKDMIIEQMLDILTQLENVSNS